MKFRNCARGGLAVLFRHREMWEIPKNAPPQIPLKPTPQEWQCSETSTAAKRRLPEPVWPASGCDTETVCVTPPSTSRLLPPRGCRGNGREPATRVPEAGVLELGSYPGPRMLSPERLALPDYEYLGRSSFSFAEGKKSRRLGPGLGRRRGGGWVGTGVGVE